MSGVRARFLSFRCRSGWLRRLHLFAAGRCLLRGRFAWIRRVASRAPSQRLTGIPQFPPGGFHELHAKFMLAFRQGRRNPLPAVSLESPGAPIQLSRVVVSGLREPGGADDFDELLCQP